MLLEFFTYLADAARLHYYYM